MINPKFLICTECLKNKKLNPKLFRTIRGFNIHLAIKHNSKYRLKIQNRKLGISRLKRPTFKSNFL